MNLQSVLRKWYVLAILVLVGSPAWAAPTITVTASSVTILGSSQTISLVCALIDPNQTGILRTGSTVITKFSASTTTPGTTATCGPIYANDVITDGFGNASTTYYLIGVYLVTSGIVASTPSLLQAYQFAGSGTFDLSSTLPYALGAVSPAGSMLGQNLTFTGANSFTQINKTVYADGVTYTTIAAALAAAPAGGTVIVPPGCSGAIATPTTTVTISQSVRLVLQCNITSSQVPNISIQSSGVTIEGSGGNSPSGGSTDGVIWTNSGTGNTIIYGDGATSFRGLLIEKLNFRDSGAHSAARSILFKANASNISIRDVVTVGISFDGSLGNQEIAAFDRVRVNNYVNSAFNFNCNGNVFCNSITFNSTYADSGTGSPGVGYDFGNGNFIITATNSDYAPVCAYRFAGGGTLVASGTDDEQGTVAGWCITGSTGNVTLTAAKTVNEVLPFSITGAANVTLINPNTLSTSGSYSITLGAGATGQNFLFGTSGLDKAISGINAPSVTLQTFGSTSGTPPYSPMSYSLTCQPTTPYPPCMTLSANSIDGGSILQLSNIKSGGSSYNIGELNAVGTLDFRNSAGGGGLSFNSNAAAGRGIFSFTNTADRTYTSPNFSGGTPVVFSCGSTGSGSQTCAPAAATVKTQIYDGESTLASNAATITFPNGFTSATSYFCVANDVTTRANPVQMIPASATTATITNTTGATDVIQWICVGN